MANPAWGNNPNILAAISAKPAGTQTRLLASLPNFEKAYFGEVIATEKPYNALKTISEQPAKFRLLKHYYKLLINHNANIPVNCAEWTSIDDLREKLEAVAI